MKQMKKQDKLTANKEDYLKTLYELSQLGQKITNKQIAEKMQFSAPAVSEMLKKMQAEGLIEKDSQLGYRLQPAALQLIASLYRKHRLIEVFLVEQLGYSPEEVHMEAEILEHTVSDHFIDRLNQLLNQPATCPHGGTIPKAGQLLEERYQTRLADLTQTGSYRLVRVHDFYQLLQYLEQQQLAIGETLQVTAIDPFAQTTTISFRDKELAIPFAIGQQLFVEHETESGTTIGKPKGSIVSSHLRTVE